LDHLAAARAEAPSRILFGSGSGFDESAYRRVRQTGALDQARALTTEALGTLPGHHELLAFAAEIGACQQLLENWLWRTFRAALTERHQTCDHGRVSPHVQDSGV
jgi:hypothetical protein